MRSSEREIQRARRHRRVRKKIEGSSERPRLVVHRSHKHIHAQIVDDLLGKTLVAVSSTSAAFQKESASGANADAARLLGEKLGQVATQAGIKQVVFDRGGYLYHGRVKALAEGARAQGLEF